MKGQTARTSVLLITVYLGELPVWYPAFLASCWGNPTVSWLVITDSPAPLHSVRNVRHWKMSRPELEALVAHRLGTHVPLDANPRKLCDLKPSYGYLFADSIRHFDYWGHCDLDVVWGDLDRALDRPLRAGKDLVTLRRGRLAGHLTLYRNRPELLRLFERSPQWGSALASSNVCMFDEVAMTDLVADLARRGELRVSWPSFVLGDEFRRVLRTCRSGWVWQDGHLTDPRNGSEVAYLHFTDWQSTMTSCDVTRPDQASRFEITDHGIVTELSLPD